MLPGDHSSLMTGTLPVVLVIAVSAIAALIILAWLVHQVARRAIDKADPQSVASVVLALGSLLSPLQMFFPWSGPGAVDPKHLNREDNQEDTQPPLEVGDGR